jgi:hypothetical protein
MRAISALEATGRSTMMRTSTRVAIVIAVAGAVAAMPGIALAHEPFKAGHLEGEVGFATEPAYVGQPNAATISITHDGTPVIDLGDSLKIEIGFGDTTSDPMALEPGFAYEDGKLEFGTPGEYEAPFVPSQPGPYTFHFVGTVDGEKFDQSFTSSPSGFDEVQDPADATFPPVNTPSTEQLVARIEQESQRVDQAATNSQNAAAVAVAANDAADSARTVGLIGVAVGAIGLIAAIAALARGRKRDA